ncbi:hypothetical protein ACFQZI_10410 [Mucilaginibacter lutimaris]|uniref:Uncharacterized protein n=1 Tax=Mucilaginibacter lutimaris TaxID=931629 RepID=A0ABW2ZGP9_9SPHI
MSLRFTLKEVQIDWLILSIKQFKIMENIEAIKPGPKPKKEDGSDDRRRHVDPPNKPKHPTLPPHVHKPGKGYSK